MMQSDKLKNIIEAALLAAGRPLTMDAMMNLFNEDEEAPGGSQIKEVLEMLEADYDERGLELKKVASGYRIQVRSEYAGWMAHLWSERPARYSRALLETMALVAYRQPVTRAEIEDVRGVAVSSNIIRTLLEREWIRLIGHRDVPGRPAMYGTTRQFLDYFNLTSLGDLPSLAEIKDIAEINGDLFKEEGDDDEGDPGEIQEPAIVANIETTAEDSSEESVDAPDEQEKQLESEQEPA